MTVPVFNAKLNLIVWYYKATCQEEYYGYIYRIRSGTCNAVS